MKKLNIMALLVGAALFTGLGTTSVMAGMGEKCGGGKCGSSTASKCGDSKAMKSKMSSMTFEDKKKICTDKLHVITQCVDTASNATEMQACRAQIVALAKKIEKMHGKSSSKCGGEKKSMKCGAGKCGK